MTSSILLNAYNYHLLWLLNTKTGVLCNEGLNDYLKDGLIYDFNESFSKLLVDGLCKLFWIYKPFDNLEMTLYLGSEPLSVTYEWIPSGCAFNEQFTLLFYINLVFISFSKLISSSSSYFIFLS
jgi:hypothetical protein